MALFSRCVTDPVAIVIKDISDALGRLRFIANTIAAVVIDPISRVPVIGAVLPIVWTVLPVIRRVIPIVRGVVPVIG